MTAGTAPAGRRRWHRAVIPFALALLVLAFTGVTYAVEQPDPTDSDFLSPVSAAPVGARRLADLLAARGITVQRETRTSDALVAAYAGGATLFIPAPALVHPDYLNMLRLMPPTTRVVLVEPQASTLARGGIPLTAAGRRWATAATGPGAGCELPEALGAGTAAALRQRYAQPDPDAQELYRCYGHGLVGLRWQSAELVAIGAVDPFRNDRIGEHGNATLATRLLATASRVIWLDLHRREPAPGMVDHPVAGPEAPPSLAPASDGPVDRGGAGDGGEPGGSSEAQSGQENPLWRAFPPWFWALLAQLALVALLLALWRARRLGPPVSEPLPVTVRSAETVLGRGRLYRRARARGPALDILRSAARTRLAGLLDLPADAQAEAVVAAVAAQTGRAPEDVDELLYGPAPENDDDLVRVASELDTLVSEVAAPPQSPTSDEGEAR